MAFPIEVLKQGLDLMDQGDLEGAERILKALVDSNPSWASWLALGRVNQKLERFEQAARCYEESARRNPGYSVYTVLANMQLAFDPKAALVNARKALELNPE